MRILVKSEGHRIWIPIPTSVVFSRPMIRLWLWGMRRSIRYVQMPEQAIWDLPEDKLFLLCDELRRIKRKYGSWHLVEVESASGDRVLIEL